MNETRTREIEETLRQTLGSARSPGLSRAFEQRLSEALDPERGVSQRLWRRRRRAHRLLAGAYLLGVGVLITAVLKALPTPTDPRVLVLSLATLLFVTGASATLALVLFLVRHRVIQPYG